MKQILLAVIALTTITLSASARKLTAVTADATPGTFQLASTWTPAVVPAIGDTLIIPTAKTVNINSNLSYAGTIIMRITGTLTMTGGGAKLALGSASQIWITPGGKIVTNNQSQEIVIGTNTVLSSPSGGTQVAANSNTLVATFSSTGFASGATLPAALPVTFTSFAATRQGKDILVQWETATEENADRFEVEISTDGRNWSSNGSVAAAGNSTIARKYNYTARSISGTVQVRIRQVDLDGKYTYTTIRTVKADGVGSIKAVATPGRLQLLFPEEVKGATVRIMNLNGQVLQEQKFASANGQVNIATNQKGICVVTVVSETEQLAAQKVIF